MYSLIVAFLSIAISISAIYLSGKANALNRNIFKRQGVIDLHMAWQDIREIDKNCLIGANVVRAVNALSLTTSYSLTYLNKLISSTLAISFKSLIL